MFSSSSQNHPLIENTNTYMYVKKYVSIHSEDRDISKYPSESKFEIELPQDYENVSSVQLHSWTFPINHSTFSIKKSNTFMFFKFDSLYNPADFSFSDTLEEAIYAGLNANINTEYKVYINEGSYTSEQMATELTIGFNEAVTNVLNTFFSENPAYASAIPLFEGVGYTQFSIVYNSVDDRFWIGNKSSVFELLNETEQFEYERAQRACASGTSLPASDMWGLPSNIGFSFPRKNVVSGYALDPSMDTNTAIENGDIVPYFHHIGKPDGLWLLPDLPGATVSYIRPPCIKNTDGAHYLYMEIDGFNCLDETSPYNMSTFTRTTNQTNGTINSAFAKIPISSRSVDQQSRMGTMPYKWFYPANERIRKLNIKLRYHDGTLASMCGQNYSFLLEFTMMHPQNNRAVTVVPRVI